MKSLLLTLALALVAFVPQSFAMDDTMHNKMEAAPVKAVVFYSDTCSSCKILGPQMMKAMQAVNTDKVDVVKFDFSSKDTIAATKILATEKGVDAVLQSYGVKTGFVVLLDKNGQEVDKLKVDDNAADIAAKITKAIVNQS